MEPTVVWPGIDSALHELRMLCSEGSIRGLVKEIPDKFRVKLNDSNMIANIGKCHDRYLLPSQAWNRPSILTEVEEISGQNDSLRNNYPHPDGENTENSCTVKASRFIKLSEPKGYSNPYSPCGSEVICGNEGISVLSMNSHYMTGVSIATAGSSGVFNLSDSYAKSTNNHSTPKHGLSAASVRHHHLRPYEIPHHLRPYEIPWLREERARTKSETAEKEAAMKLMDCIDVSVNYPVIDSYSKSNTEKCRRSLLKSRSLENVRLAEDESLQVPVHEMDSMSKRIQHLHVDE